MGEPGALGAEGPWGGHQQRLPRGPDRKRVASPALLEGLRVDRVEASKEQGLPARGHPSSRQEQCCPRPSRAGRHGYPDNRGLASARASVEPAAATVGETPAEQKVETAHFCARRTPATPAPPPPAREPTEESGRLSLKEGACPRRESPEQSSLRSQHWGSLSALWPSAMGTWDSNTCDISHRSYRPGAGGGYRHKAEISDKSPVMKRKLTRVDPNKIADQDKYFHVLFKLSESKMMHEPQNG